jgi:Bacteriocin class II with double-glycine leader peptide
MTMAYRVENGVQLDDAALEAVNGGFNVLKQLENIGRSTVDGAKKGVDIGIYAGPPGILGGGAAGAYIGAINGVKNAVGEGLNEAIGGLKSLFK